MREWGEEDGGEAFEESPTDERGLARTTFFLTRDRTREERAGGGAEVILTGRRVPHTSFFFLGEELE